ncbi:biotin--[acetyl-CoA-carboxylase] ligase [Lacticaseibacillus zhaodongensis]|uniref:biotin--[acetyl-CoA-carboxylase] ligase n=1 Tax=Lacticaseibacillus zhaodongensis TaxID=2668065 RepID=UPI0012D3247C|nr:biotin--[acetyl-CoA-carboxylase] ligase [Lacticaseibacillus zhaodongensis]
MAVATRTRVLNDLLAHPNTWRSGDVLAQDLAVSRETIWKAINALRKSGHIITARKSQGYQYTGCTQLDQDAINFYSQRHPNFTVLATTDSTQLRAKELLNTGKITEPTAIIADQQTRGYGRRGRDFYSPQASGLYMSVIMPNPSGNLTNAGLLTTGVAAAAVQVLADFFPNKHFGLKWVNDILLNEHKVGGIITEAVMEMESASSAAFIVGMGLNLTTADFPAAISSKAGAIAAGADVDRNRLAAALLDRLTVDFSEFTSGSLLPVYRQYSLLIGRTVTLNLGQSTVTGRVQGIADDGSIILAQADGSTQNYSSGEVVRVMGWQH